MKRRNVLTLSVFALLFIASCTKKNGEENTTSGTTNGGNNGGGTTTTTGPLFTAVRTVVRANCAVSGCHTTPNPQSGVNFSDDNTIVSLRLNIKTRAVDQAGTANQMPQPPLPPLSTTDRQKIVDWINAGGKITD
jgi:uncharacterized membrane protein